MGRKNVELPRVFFRKSDIAVIAVIGCLALGIWGWLMLMPQPEKKQIEISCDGKVVQTISLPAADRLIKVGAKKQVTLKLEKNQICFWKTDCPDRICVRTGFIGKVGQSAVCLPNRVVVKIIGGAGNETGVDGVAG